MADAITTAIYQAAFDAGQYKAGVDQKVAADQKAVTSGERVVVSEEKVTRATRSSAEAIDRKIARLDPLYAAEQRYAKALEMVQRYEEEGVGSAAQRARLIELETQKYQQQIAALERLNAVRAAGPAAAIDPTFARLGAGAIANARLLEGMGEAGQAAFGKIAVSAERAAAESAALSARISAGMSIVGRANLEALQANERLVAGMSMGSGQIVSGIRNVGNQTKQLSFQLFDIAQGIPLAFQSPLYGLQNLAIQTGQVAQLYQGQGGLKQAFADTTAVAKGLGSALLLSIATPVGLATSGLVAAGAAAGAFLYIVKSQLPNAETALRRHEEIIRDIRAAWKDAGEGARGYGSLAQSEITFRSNQDLLEQRRLLEFQARGTGRALEGVSTRNFLGLNITAEQRALRAFQPAIDEFLHSMQNGSGDVASFRDEVLRLANIDPTNRALQDAADRLLKLTQSGADAAQRIREINDLLGETTRLLSRTAEAGALRNLAQSTADQLFDLRRQHAADLGRIGARSPADLAAAARARVLAEPQDFSRDPTGAIRAYRAESAAALALAESLHTLSEAQRQRGQAARDSLGSAQLDLDLVGKGIGQSAELRANWQAYTALRKEAEDNNIRFDRAEYDRLRAINAEIAQRVQLQARAALRSDLGFDRAQLARTETERRVAEEMRQLWGEDYPKYMNSAEAAQIRFNAALEKTIQRLDAVRGSVQDTIGSLLEGLQKGDLGSALERSIENIRGRLNDQIAKSITEGLLGQQGQSGGGAFGTFFAGLLGGGAEARGATPVTPLYVSVVNALGGGIPIPGGGGVGDIIGGIFNGRTAATSAGSVEQQVYSYFAAKGLQPYQIAGIMGNIHGESGFDPFAINPSSGAAGLFQYLGPRKTGLLAYGGGQVPGVQGQLDYAWSELHGPERATLARLLSSRDVRGATGAFAGFERAEGWSPGNQEGIAGWSSRLEAAQKTLAVSSEKFSGQFSGSLGALGTGMQQTVGAFGPQFGGSLQDLLKTFSATGSSGSFGGWLNGIFGGGFYTGAPLPGAGLFHQGGIAGSAMQARTIHPAYFDDAPRYHSGGIAGLRPNEVPAILERGERILPRGSSGMVPEVKVYQTTINQAGSDVQAETTVTPRGDGGVDIETRIVKVVDQVVQGKYGFRPKTRPMGVA